MPPTTRSKTKAVPPPEEPALPEPAPAPAKKPAEKPAKKPTAKKPSKAPAKRATKNSEATVPDAASTSDRDTTPTLNNPSGSKLQPKKRKAKHTFTLHTDITYWDEDTDEDDWEQESFTGTKASANRYLKSYLKHVKSTDRGIFRTSKVGRLDRDENGLFTYEFDDMCHSRYKVIMMLKMYLTIDIEDTKVEDDE